jgi:hypothetical protein
MLAADGGQVSVVSSMSGSRSGVVAGGRRVSGVRCAGARPYLGARSQGGAAAT